MSKTSQKKEQFIKETIETFNVTREEALEMWKFDHGEIENEEVNQIEEKLSEKPKKKNSSINKVKSLKAKQKEDKEREVISKAIEELIDNHELTQNPQWLTKNKITFKTENGEYYSITITHHRSKPDGFAD